jgi:glycosyltransferase involved in cell wall biosynthesis
LQPRVALIATPGTTPTGLTRLSFSIQPELRKLGFDAVVVRPQVGRPVQQAYGLGRRLGVDLERFFAQYPLHFDLPDADIYHLTSQYFASALMLQRFDRPVVVTAHDMIAYVLGDDPRLNCYGHAAHRWFDHLAMRGLKRADALIADSEWTKRTIMAELGIPGERIRVIPLGVDLGTFHRRPVDDDFRARAGLSADCRWILYVGSEQPRKNFLALIRAFAELRRTRPDLRLVKIGNPELEGERRKAVALARRLGILDDILFRRTVPEADLPRYYSAADLFVFPSLYEGFGLPPLEALACGAPVVCSNATSLPEVVGDAAITCPPDVPSLARAMAQVLDNPSCARELAERGPRRARLHTWERTARETAEVYAEVGAHWNRQRARQMRRIAV